MFRERLITTLILVPLVLLGIYFANYWFFAAVFAVATVICAYEWLQLIPLNLRWQQILFLTAVLFLMYAIHFYFPVWQTLGLIAWVAIAIAIGQYPESKRWWGYPAIVIALAAIVLPLFFQSMLQVIALPLGKSLLIYLLMLVWAADIGAYLAGKQWGKHKLIPAVSPGKTIEGFTGGMCLSLLVSLIALNYFQPSNTGLWFIMTLAIVVIALVGDLFISVLKRRTGVKDTGHIIPGHGGMLDRLDSLIAAAPFFYAALSYFNPGL